MPSKSNKWQGRYLEWRQTDHGKEVYVQARDLALKMIGRKFAHYSIRLIAHVIRYHRHVSHGPDAEGYKINNNYLSYLSRELMACEWQIPDDFFPTREKDVK